MFSLAMPSLTMFDSHAVLGKQPASATPAAEPAPKRPKMEGEDLNDVLQVIIAHQSAFPDFA